MMFFHSGWINRIKVNRVSFTDGAKIPVARRWKNDVKNNHESTDTIRVENCWQFDSSVFVCLRKSNIPGRFCHVFPAKTSLIENLLNARPAALDSSRFGCSRLVKAARGGAPVLINTAPSCWMLTSLKDEGSVSDIWRWQEYRGGTSTSPSYLLLLLCHTPPPHPLSPRMWVNRVSLKCASPTCWPLL